MPRLGDARAPESWGVGLGSLLLDLHTEGASGETTGGVWVVTGELAGEFDSKLG